MRQLFLAFLIVAPAWACTCFNTATPCSVLGGPSVIFVADVVADSGEGWGQGPATVKIVEPLQNVPTGLKEATIDTAAGTSCYFRLLSGRALRHNHNWPALLGWRMQLIIRTPWQRTHSRGHAKSSERWPPAPDWIGAQEHGSLLTRRWNSQRNRRVENKRISPHNDYGRGRPLSPARARARPLQNQPLQRTATFRTTSTITAGRAGWR